MTDSSTSLMVYSHLISSRDNALLFNLLGPSCTALASAVAQVCVAFTEPGGHEATWKCKDSGVACLVKDQSLGSNFLRLFSVKRAKLLWEQELYTPFRYSAPRPFFHTFTADDFQAGLNFADEEEAENFLSVVKTQIKSAQDEGRKSLIENTQVHSVLDSPTSSAQMTLTHMPKPSSGQFFASKLNKPDTKLPSNFDIVNYSSENPGKSLDKLLEKAGMNEADLKGKRVSRNYTIAERPEGLEVVQKDSELLQLQKFPKCRRAVSSLAQKKGPLPPLPTQSRLDAKRKPWPVSLNNSNQDSHKGPFSTAPFTHDAIPPPPSIPAPRIPPVYPSQTQMTVSNR